MINARVTVVVVPRERFSVARRSMESLIANTPAGINMICVDGGSPPSLHRYLERASARHRFRLLRYDCYLSPNEARNIGFAEVKTPYVVFVDNDIIFSPGWLENLVACAEETGAWLVGPLYCEGDPVHEIIHMAGGDAFLEDNAEGRWLYEVHRYVGEPLAHVRHRLRREPTQVVEFHVMLVQSDALRRLGPLDEGLMCTREHLDLCLRVLRAGGAIYLEPRAVITNLQPPPVAWSDLPFYLLRWSDEWTHTTYQRLAETWGVDDGRNVDLRRRIHTYRRQGLPLLRAAAAIFGESAAQWFDAVLDNWLTAAARRRRKRVLAGRVALTPQQPAQPVSAP
jgi:GT2 family glycosyltransferase